MGKTGVFFPQQALDAWLLKADVEFVHGVLTLRSERRSYRLVEALRVLAEVTGVPDAYEITGKVKTLAFLTELGASVLAESLVIGDNGYQVVRGWLGFPLGSFTELRRERTQGSDPHAATAFTARSDEELLAQVVMRNA